MRATVLVVEDDETVRDEVRELLEGEGHTVALAADGVEALAYLRAATAPHVILLDVQMPRMDGWAFCDVRRTDPALSAIPLVLMSANAGPTRVAPYVGVDALLAKPFAPEAVLDAVRRFARGNRSSE